MRLPHLWFRTNHALTTTTSLLGAGHGSCYVASLRGCRDHFFIYARPRLNFEKHHFHFDLDLKLFLLSSSTLFWFPAHWRNLQCERKRAVVKSIKQIKGTWHSLEFWSYEYEGGDMELVIVGWTRHVPSFRISTCWAFRRARILNSNK